MPNRPLLLLALGTLAIHGGCANQGVPEYPVSGIVRLENGMPVQAGVVEFTSADQIHTVRANLNNEGQFSLRAVAGKHHVVVVQLIVTEELPLHEHDHDPTIDPDFGHYQRSGLSYLVKPGQNDNAEFIVRELDKATSDN